MKKQTIIWIYTGVVVVAGVVMAYLVFTSSNVVPILIAGAIVVLAVMLQILRVSRRPR